MTPTTAEQFHALQARSTSEADLLAAVRRVANVSGWRAYHTYRSDKSEPGFPDLVLVRDERLVFAELKAQRGRLEPAQHAWLNALAVVERVETYVWRPLDALNKTILEVLR